jgi:ribosome-associated protein
MLKDGRDFSQWIYFLTSRSSGPGGQNVNKVNTRVELHFELDECTVLSESEKEKIRTAYPGRIRANGHFIVVRQTERSQHKNKEAALAVLYELIEQALKPRKKRIRTKPTQAMVQKRLEKKRRQSEKKKNRRGGFEV